MFGWLASGHLGQLAFGQRIASLGVEPVFKTGDIDRVRKLQDGYRRAAAGKNPIRGEILTHDRNNPQRRVPGWARRQASARGQREGWARLILRQG